MYNSLDMHFILNARRKGKPFQRCALSKQEKPVYNNVRLTSRLEAFVYVLRECYVSAVTAEMARREKNYVS